MDQPQQATALTASPLPRVQLLGPPLLWPAGSPPGTAGRPLGRNDALLLALLAVQGPLPRQRIASLLWPDHAPPKAALSLRQRVHQLKRNAGTEVLLGDPLLALAAGLQHDLAADEGTVEATLQADPGALRGTLLDGVALGARDDLAEAVVQWRQQWDERRARVLHRLVDRAWAAAAPDRALLLARRLVADNPSADPAHRRLIELHYLCGDRDAALAAYSQCCEALAQGLGTAPSEATEALLRLVRRAERLAPAPTARPDTALLRPPRLVGRAALWASLTGALAAGRPVLLTGEAGVGKTRLLAETAAALGGWPEVTAATGEADLPYALLARLVEQLARHHGRPEPAWVAAELARLVPGLGPTGMAEPFTMLRLQRALRLALLHWGAATPPLQGLALDDLHFADAASLDLLLPLVAAADSGGLRWLLAARPEALATPALQRQLAEAAWQVLPVPALDTAGVHALVDAVQLPGLDAAALAPRLAQATGGNPLFLLQTLAAMQAQGGGLSANPLQGLPAPEAAVALIARRVALLGSPARQLLRLAALAGAEFNADLAATVLRLPPLAIADAWAELEAAQLLRGEGLAHDLVRQAVLQGLPEALARATHRALAAALAHAAAPPASVARHWQAAQAWPEAAAAWDAVAAAASQRSATVEELAALQAAWECLDAAAAAQAAALPPAAPLHADGQRLSLGLRWARALLHSDVPDAALARLDSVAAAAQAMPHRADWLLLRGQVLVEQMASAAGLASAQEALALAEGAGDAVTALLAAQCAAKALMRLDRLGEALALMPEAPTGWAQLSAEQRLYWLSDRALLLDHAGQRLASLQVYDQVVREAEAQQRWLPAADALCNQSVALMYLGRLADSHRAVERSLANNRRAGVDGAGLLIDEMNQAGNWRDMGWFDAYLPRAQTLAAELRAAGLAVWAVNADNDLAVAYAWLGRVDLVRRLLQPLDDTIPAMMRVARLIVRLRLARDFGATALAPRPQQVIAEAEALLAVGGSRGGHIRHLVAMEQALLAAPAQGAAVLLRIETEALAQQNLMFAAGALRTRIGLLLAAGDAATAAHDARRLMAACAGHGPPPGTYAPALWWAASQALAVQAPDLAAEALRLAAGWIHQTAQRTPATFRDTFLQRNPVNRAVLQAVQARR